MRLGIEIEHLPILAFHAHLSDAIVHAEIIDVADYLVRVCRDAVDRYRYAVGFMEEQPEFVAFVRRYADGRGVVIYRHGRPVHGKIDGKGGTEAPPRLRICENPITKSSQRRSSGQR